MINNLIIVKDVSCPEDEVFQQIVQTAVSKLYQSMAPLKGD